MERRDLPALNSESLNSTQWRNVDQAADSAEFVNYLAARNSGNAEAARRSIRSARLNIRAGDRILDVGCGLGEDVQAFAQIVGNTGQVVGIDASVAMIEEARKRAQGMDLPLEFHVGNVYTLEIPDNAFDGCQAVRLVQHLDDPGRALAEMVRVVRPGGRIVVHEAEWETLVVDAPDRNLTRKILNFEIDRLRHPWMGRRLFGLLREAGLEDIAIESFVNVTTDPASPTSPNLNLNGMRGAAQRAQAAGVVSAAETASWLESLESAGHAGRYFASLTAFLVAGRKP